MKEIEILVDFIYGLYVDFEDERTYFYIGRSIHPTVRLKEHHYAKKNGTESKYQFIRDLERAGLVWNMEILDTITTAEQEYESWWVYKMLCEKHPLQNMKAGDIRQAAQQDAMHSMVSRKESFNDARTFLDAQEREIKEAAARAATARLQAKSIQGSRLKEEYSPGETLFDWEKPERRFISPAMKTILARRGRSF